MYKTDHSAVFNGTAEDFYEFAMAHGIEEAFKVKVYYILAFGYVIPAIRAYSGLAPVRQCLCRAY